MRNLVAVLDEVVEVAPDLEVYFKPLIDSVKYSAPEMMSMRWHQAAEILNEFASEHPKRAKIAKIFSGE